MRCIVTGGLGFIGSNLTDQLINLGHEVCVIDNLSTGKLERLNPKAKLMESDVQEDIYKILEMDYSPEVQFDVIFHLGAQARIQPSFDRPIETADSNIMGTVQILELARKVGARVVYAGSSSFYGDPHKNPYALSKWLGEEMCIMYNRVYKVPVVIARFFNVYGPRHPYSGQYATVIGVFEMQRKTNTPITVVGTGEQKRDFTHVSDIVNGLVAMSKDNWTGEIFNLGCGVNYSINEVADLFQSKCGIEYLPQRPGEADVTLADISFTQEKLFWVPKYDLKTYINEFLDKIDPIHDVDVAWEEWINR